jgi:bifunctional NMN adenylyltransferase/nudix hydrolase
VIHGTAVIVGRFQVPVLSPAHQKLIQRAEEEWTNVVIFVGVPRLKVSFRNPLDYQTVAMMVSKRVPHATVLPLPDMRDNQAWVKTLETRAREVAVGSITMYGGRDSFLPTYEENGGTYPMVEIEETGEDSGTLIRYQESYAPLNHEYFRSGVIYASQRRHVAGLPTVDVAIVDRQKQMMLLAKKPGETRWRFVGGFYDPEQDRGLEHAAMREVQEETGLSVQQFPTYITSHRVNDWRYAGERDQIVTSLFLAINEDGAARANDDIAEVKWCTFEEIQGLFARSEIIEEHDILMKRLLDHPAFQELL